MPKNTIKILKKLNVLGFSKANFSIIHHMPNVTMHQNSSYCETVKSFRAGNNENICLRLSYILTALDNNLKQYRAFYLFYQTMSQILSDQSISIHTEQTNLLRKNPLIY